MFTDRSWAQAFINSLEKDGADAEDGINTLMAFASWAVTLSGEVSGKSVSKKLEPIILRGIATSGSPSKAQMIAARFFLLVIEKHKIRHFASIIGEIKKIVNKKRGIIIASIEYAFEDAAALADESPIKEAIKKRTGATTVELTRRVNPELIGGYRLKMEDEIIDASIRHQLQKMEVRLAGGSQW